MPRRIVSDIDEKREEVANAAGVAIAVLGPVPGGEVWLIGRAIVSSTSAAISEARVYIGGNQEPPSELDLIDGSTSGNLDVADNASPWRVPAGKHLVIRWTGATAGAFCRTHVQGVIVQTS